jgi:hypothetical protein
MERKKIRIVKKNKKVVFSIDFCEETVTFKENATDEEIDKAFQDWFDDNIVCGWTLEKDLDK